MTQKFSESSVEKPSIKKDNPSKYSKKFPDGETNVQNEVHDSQNRGYQGSGKRSADPVFEKKRTEFRKLVAEADNEIAKYRNRLEKIDEEAYILQSGNQEKSGVKGEIRNRLSDSRNKLKAAEEEKHLLIAKLKDIQESQKKKIDELNNAKEKLPYKRIDEIDKKIIEMEKQLETGSLKLIEEKRAVAEMSKMRKNRKALEALSGQQSVVDEFKKQVDIIRASISEKEKEIKMHREFVRNCSTELSNVGGGQKDATVVKLKALSAEKDTIKKKMKSCYDQKNAAYEEFQLAQAAHKVWFEEEMIRKDEANKRRDIERIINELEHEFKNLELPACASQIDECVNLQNYLRTNFLHKGPLPISSVSTSSSTQPSSQGNINVASLEVRQVEKLDPEAVLKTKLNRNEEDTFYFIGSYGKKGNQKSSRSRESNNGTKANIASGSENGPIKFPFWVVSGLEELGVGCPKSVNEMEDIINKLEQVKESFVRKQEEKLKSVDGERLKLTEKINAQKKRLDAIKEEVLAERNSPEHKAKFNRPQNRSKLNQENNELASSAIPTTISKAEESIAA